MPINIYSIHLKLIRLNFQYDVLSDFLKAQQNAIDALHVIVAEAQKSGNEDYIEATSDEQSEIVESLLGCSFVAAQAYITYVVSHIKALHRTTKKNNMSLSSTSDSKSNIMTTCSPIIAGTTIASVEAINALVNYYKHNDEWESDWTKEAGQTARTIAILTPLDLSPASTGNLRTSLNAFGGNIVAIPDVVRQWQLDLASKYEAELLSLSLQ